MLRRTSKPKLVLQKVRTSLRIAMRLSIISVKLEDELDPYTRHLYADALTRQLESGHEVDSIRESTPKLNDSLVDKRRRKTASFSLSASVSSDDNDNANILSQVKDEDDEGKRKKMDKKNALSMKKRTKWLINSRRRSYPFEHVRDMIATTSFEPNRTQSEKPNRVVHHRASTEMPSRLSASCSEPNVSRRKLFQEDNHQAFDDRSVSIMDSDEILEKPCTTRRFEKVENIESEAPSLDELKVLVKPQLEGRRFLECQKRKRNVEELFRQTKTLFIRDPKEPDFRCVACKSGFNGESTFLDHLRVCELHEAACEAGLFD